MDRLEQLLRHIENNEGDFSLRIDVQHDGFTFTLFPGWQEEIYATGKTLEDATSDMDSKYVPTDGSSDA